MSLNKVITSVNALVNSVSIPDEQLNNVVCIDTINNRIGVQTANPTREIDISGMLKTNYIYLNNENNSKSEFDISYDTNFITLSRGLKVKEGISCENIFCNFIDLSSITGDVSLPVIIFELFVLLLELFVASNSSVTSPSITQLAAIIIRAVGGKMVMLPSCFEA